MKQTLATQPVAYFFWCFIILLFSFQSRAAIQDSISVNLQAKKITISQVFKALQKQTGFIVFYNNKLLDDQEKIDVHFVHAGVRQVMDYIVKGRALTYMIKDRFILLQKKQAKRSATNVPPVIEKADVAEDTTISGTVTDEAGEPLIGVSVSLKGTQIGAITDEQGHYSLTIPDLHGLLLFSYVGYNEKEESINGRQNIDVMMKAGVASLNQLVIVGYGTQRKKDVTGSISQINFDDEGLNDMPVTNVAKALQGRIPNLNITFSTGRPGVGGGVNVRGYNSINGGSPLVLVDGVPQSINTINPNDVKSVTVLKDAGAAAIYGARGAYGVVLIETKSGNKGKPEIHYSTNYGVATQTQKTDFITTGYDEVKLWDEAMERTLGHSVTGYTQHDYDELEARRYDKYEDPSRPWSLVENRNGKDQFVYYGNFDWWNYMYRKYQPFSKHSLSISGGSEKIDYLLSGDIRTQAGVWKINPDIYKGQNLRAKVGAKLYPWLRVTNNASFYHYKYNFGRYNAFSSMNSVYEYLSPSYLPVNPDGTYTETTGMGNYSIDHGIAGVMLDGRNKAVKSQYVFRNTTGIEMSFFDNKLNIKGNYTGVIYQTAQSYRQVPVMYSLYPGVSQVNPYVNKDWYEEWVETTKQNMINGFATYRNHYGKHSFSVMGGVNFENSRYKKIQGTVEDLLSKDLSDLSLGTNNPLVDGSATEWDILGFFGRVTYNYDSKYYFQFNGRYDGTSRFPESSRFGFFPSFSAAWAISEESFFDDLKNTINHLKIRATYGSLGNQSVGIYAYIPTMYTGTSSYLIDNQRTNYIGMPNPVSSALTWEEVITKNLGIDFSILENRLTASLDGYIKETKGMLAKGKTLPAVFGASEPQENAADLKNQGWEVSLQWKSSFKLAKKDFKYYVKIGVADYTGEITKFDNPDSLISEYYVGHKLGDIWGFTVDGYFKTQNEADSYPVNQSYVNKRIDAAPPAWRGLKPGDMKFVDLNGDNVIGIGRNTVSDPGDRRIIGNSTPRYKFGITLGGSWDNIDLSLFIQGVVEQDWYPNKEAIMFWGPYARPYTSFIPKGFERKIWSKDNPNAYFPLLRGYIANNGSLYYANNKYLQDLGYARLKNLSIGYTLPFNFLDKIGVEHLRIYFSGDDLFTISKLDTKYIDPEQAGAGDFNHSTDDARVYPFSTKMYSFGLDVTF